MNECTWQIESFRIARNQFFFCCIAAAISVTEQEIRDLTYLPSACHPCCFCSNIPSIPEVII
jgi:hypothetical protein